MSTKARRGFAAMKPEQQRKIAKRGGRAAHINGRAHEFTSEEARQAGLKGGATISQDRAYMSRIAILGGMASQRSRRRNNKARG